MRKKNVTMFASILEILIGVAVLLSSLSSAESDYWGGMGFALIAMGIVQLMRRIRYKTNEDYRQSVDVERNDERNRYLGMKAWAWAGYLYVMIAAVASIGLKVSGQDELSIFAGYSVCLILVLFWGSWLWLKRKY